MAESLVRCARHLSRCEDPALIRALAADLAEHIEELGNRIEPLITALRQAEARNAEQEAALTRARQAAARDALTGLANRRIFDQSLARLIEAGRPFVLCLIDIDHFKKVNDTYGHPAGDQVLREVARLLLHRVRESDILARIGGEEFALLLPETTLIAGQRIADKARTAIERHTLRRSSDGKNPLIRVTASVGVAEYLPGEEADQVMARADDALYRAKRDGRNRVELATGQLELEI